MTWILALLASVALAQNPPYTIKETKTGEDAAALNSNIRALADSIRKSDAARRTLENSVTAAVSGGAVLAATQTFSGGNTFVSSMTISGPSNLWVRIASGNWVHQTTVTFSGLRSSATYKIEFNIWNSSDQATPAMVFNNDGTSESYQYNSIHGNQGVGVDYGMPSFSIPLTTQYAGYRNVVDSAIIGEALITTAFMRPQIVLVNIRTTSEEWASAANYAATHIVGGRWKQATTPANLSSVHFICSTANMHNAAATRTCPINGHFELWKKHDDFPVNSP